LGRPFTNLVDERLHPLAAGREDVGIPLYMRVQDAHRGEGTGRRGRFSCNWLKLDKAHEIDHCKSYCG
jgi:hypothetical protein